MKTFISTCLLLVFSCAAKGDIPREDVIAFTYGGETYYTHVFTGGYTFTGDSVLDYQANYLGQLVDFVSIYNGKNKVVAYPDLIRIPRIKVGQKYYAENDGYYNKDILVLRGKKIIISKDSLKLVAADSLIIGYAAGEILSPTLSKADESWINDYPLERIAKFNDGEICDIELFAIKGNVTFIEAYNIKADLLDYYKSLHLQDRDKVPAKTADDIYAELLKRHILMIGFCSC